MAKRKCNFNDSLQKEYPFLEKYPKSMVMCRICSSKFSISTGGKSHITTHLKSEKHKNAAAARSSSSSVTNFMINLSDDSQKIALAEGVFAYHNVKHSLSFREMDCFSKLMKTVYNSSYSCARTKCEAIIENVYEPWAIEDLTLQLQNTSYVTIYSDSSNHGNVKVFPILIRFFDSEKGIIVKLLELSNIGGENSDLVSTFILNTLKKHKLTEKVLAFCADNTNVNFGGSLRNGTNNIFSKIKEDLNVELIGIGCAAHIVNNALQSASDSLPIDVETVLVKVYSHFYIYTNRVEELKDYCNYVSVEYHQVLGYCKTRWLSLLPAINRFITMFKPLKTYFLSQKSCPVVLRRFFDDKTAEFWLHFIQQQAVIFSEVVTQIEGQTTTVFEVSSILNNLVIKYKSRIEDKFVSSDLRSLLPCSTSEEFLENILEFYSNCVNYLEKWITPFKPFEAFEWMSLKSIPVWNKIENSLHNMDVSRLKIEETKLYDEFVFIKSYIHKEISKWNADNQRIDERWKEIFLHAKDTAVNLENALKLVQFIMCIPGTNAPTERVFSAMNQIWTVEKSQLNITTLRAMLILKTNFNLSCTEFYQKLASNQKILKKIHSSTKYKHVTNK